MEQPQTENEDAGGQSPLTAGLGVSRRNNKPSYRVHNALVRLTRERWICGDDMRDLCCRLSKIAAPGAWGTVMKRAMPGECGVVGMWRGEPPAYIWDTHYKAVCKALFGAKTQEDASIELLILNLTLRSINHDK